MKLIHTADWHLGQMFFDHDRKTEHLVFLNWLKKQVWEQGVDVLLIAGDVFDSPNPSAEAQKMYYRFLRDITMENPDLQIIIIAGNHDSAARLEAPNPLLETVNVAVRGIVKHITGREIDCEHLIIPLNKGGYCLAVPYLRQGDYPESATYAGGVQEMYKMLIDKVEGKPIIAMGHLQATGSEISQNDRAERTIIGGLECISLEAFDDGIDYCALGHLHRAQRVSERENVRYAGAPLQMSFAEKNNKQGVNLITITDKTEIERLDFDTPVKLISIPNEPLPMAEVIAEIEKLPDGEVNYRSPFLEIKVRITEPEPSLRYQIEQALKGKAVRLARIEASTPQSENTGRIVSYEMLQEINPLDMATDIFKRKYGGEDMSRAMKELLQSVIREVEL
ncbi:MAG: exonuclease SbcCD subunit D C-terminal domain-containing protein [Cytophagaceae bacterium]|jgi:exonuclease SbcD|nr:exonuclease SbcCD subunit D C-terminal domain-containing protein [Cytophagaceae bacterium]